MKKFLLVLTWLISAPLLAQSLASSASDQVYRSLEVDQKPELINGMYTLALFVGENFKLPSELHNKKVKVFVGFIVEVDGTTTAHRYINMNVKPLREEMNRPLSKEERASERALLKSMEEEALRVIQLFDGKWKPAMKDGKIVRCQVNVPFNLNLE